MSPGAATWVVGVAGVYLGIGVLFALLFVWRGAGRIDPSAADGTLGFRMVILPGVAALWPLLAYRWLAGVSAPPGESNAHRRQARSERTG